MVEDIGAAVVRARARACHGMDKRLGSPVTNGFKLGKLDDVVILATGNSLGSCGC